MSFTFTHGIIGWMIGGAIGKSRKSQILGLMAGMLPDLDGLLIFINYPLHVAIHRYLFHSVIYAAGLALLGGMILKKQIEPKLAATIIFLSFTAHLITDALTTTKGVALIAPISYDLYWLPIFEFKYWPEVVICLLFIYINRGIIWKKFICNKK
jgi:membrane-bound metal-dependent hydrolase YbcI (DUF457 family)